MRLIAVYCLRDVIFKGSFTKVTIKIDNYYNIRRNVIHYGKEWIVLVVKC